MIESLDNKKIKELRKLKDKKYRDKEKKYLVEGIHLVLEAYKKGDLLEIILGENEDVDILVSKVYVSNQILKSLSSLETPYKVIGVCKYPNEDLELGDKLLILDGVQDPGNLGTIIRSSVAFNISTVVLGNNCVDLYNSKVIRACQGMNFHINIIRRDLKDFITNIKKEDYYILGTNVNDGSDLKSISNLSKYAIIMGNEGNGVSKEIQDMCDKNIYIKMNDKCESLNVAVATSIILYELDN
mgnify:FL=1